MTATTIGRDSSRVLIFDTTLRDGEQAPGCSMSLVEKVSVAEQLRAGIPGAELTRISQAGHLTNLESPTAFHAAVYHFLEPRV